MTIISTDERVEPAALEVAPPPAPPAQAPRLVAPDPAWAWVETEDAEPPETRTDWLTRFAWAKAAGGW